MSTTWVKISLVKETDKVDLLGRDAKTSKMVAVSDVKKELTALINNILSNDETKKATKDYKFFDVINDLNVYYEDVNGNRVRLYTSELDAKKIDNLLAAVEAAPKVQY